MRGRRSAHRTVIAPRLDTRRHLWPPSIRRKQAFTRNIAERQKDYPHVDKEFGHLEGDTIVGVKHKSAVVTLTERIFKLIITVKPDGRRAIDIQRALDGLFQNIPSNLFKSIAFDNGKEFSNWRDIANEHDIDIYFCDPGTPRSEERRVGKGGRWWRGSAGG